MSKSRYSELSRASQKTQQLMEEISSMNESKLVKAQGAIDANTLYNIWAALGSLISKSLKLGRALQIPKFGTFTFSYPEIDLKHTTNAESRNSENREPVFIVSKEFAQGSEIKSGVFREKGLRPFQLTSLNGNIQMTQLSFTELGALSKTDKDIAYLAIQRIKYRLEQLIKQNPLNEAIVLEIPCVGTLMIKNSVCAVNFSEFLVVQLQGIFKETMDQRRSKISNLTSLKLQQLEENYKNLDEGAKQWLGKNLNIDAEKDWKRKIFFAKTPDALSIKNDDIISQFQRTSCSTLFGTVGNKAYRPKRFSDKPEKFKTESDTTSVNNQPKESAAQTIANYKIFKQFQNFIKNKFMSSEASFKLVLNEGTGNQHLKNLMIDQTTFKGGLQKISFEISDQDLEQLFKFIDNKKDGLIDQEEWNQHFTFDRTPQEWIQSVKSRENINQSELMKNMGISKNKLELSFQDVVICIKRLMNCKLNESDKITKFILKDKQSISVKNLISVFTNQSSSTLIQINEQDGLKSEALQQGSKVLDKKKQNLKDGGDNSDEWLMEMYKKIKRNLNSRLDKDVLQNKLQQMDAHNRGYLDMINFSSCLLQCKLGLNPQEIDKICELIEKSDASLHIDYSKFLQKVENSLKIQNSKEGLDFIATQIQNYIKMYCNNDVHKFLQKLKLVNQQKKSNQNTEGMLLNNFVKGLQQLIFQKDPQIIANSCDIIDIDKDGFIDKFDLETFLKRYSYIQSSIGHNDFSQSDFTKNQENYRVFPTKEIQTDQLERIIRDLKNHLVERKISLYDSFKFLDSNNDGFITISELNENLQKNLQFQLSQLAINGLFSYLDYLRIGMFDYSRWHQVLSRIILQTEPIISDNFDYQYQLIKQVQEWFAIQNMSSLDAFRIADKDFDGYINKEDLKKFLLENVNVSSKELTVQNLDRLFKLIDRSKKNSIDRNDFIVLIDPKNQISQISQKSLKSFKSIGRYQTVSDSIKTSESNGFEPDNQNWIKNCLQQISIYFSKQEKNIQEQFEIVSGYKPQVTYSRFVKWIEQSDALHGFNLTDKLSQQLFSYLDPHKKGFITIKDWKNCLSNYLGYEEVKLKEIKEALLSSFSTILEGFNYLSNNKLTINFLNFSKAMSNLFPGQYNSTIKQKIWLQMIQQIGINVQLALKSTIDFQQFCQIFELDSKDQQIISNSFKQKSFKSSNISSLCSSSFPPQESVCYDDCAKAFKRMKNLLFLSNKNILQEFQKVDTSGLGYVSIIEFKNILQNLNLGLSGSDINLIIQFIDPTSSKVCSYKQFLKSIKIDSNTESILKRSSNRIVTLRKALYEYMITPKDAFRQADSSKKGYMNFQDFSKFMEQIQNLSKSEEHLGFQILRDMFDFIDVKGDGIIDLQEWLSAFMKYEDCRVRRFGFSSHSNQEESSKENSIDFKTKGNQSVRNENYKQVISASKTMMDFLPKKLENFNSRSKQKTNTTVKSLLNQSSKQLMQTLSDSKIIKSINDYYAQNSINPTQWEQSSEYDKTQMTIARNRKQLLQQFMEAHQIIATSQGEKPKKEVQQQDQNNEGRSGSPKKRSISLPKVVSSQNSQNLFLPTHIVQNIISNLLESQKIQVHQNSWQTLLGFAEKQQGQIDFRFLLEVYKNKLIHLEAPPNILNQKLQSNIQHA
ncbi:EF-hand protein (macronuclear) [Tetrahymena thermophila SB210]|uniref:EF-hand protein n=1 Tax=Tetrahymena thermophila (strain SB210) TaxID=312017 RepID=Q22RP4_TETTS|nr:EF-hand protein [Tetrahymena thermophila SB210]EAR88078.2 EF-hand protein [Tetrahymena thermophila SB210]|eukprot:XP_001008323.2 EF-hand protein [Tetrahymena thermophila SB210]